MSETDATRASARQDPLCERYKVAVGASDHGGVLDFGIHRAVGGYSDAPNPGDMLCAALAACLDSSIRIIANRFGVALDSLEVEVIANVDVRGALRVDNNVPVGFQRIQCHVNLQAAEGTDPNLTKKIVSAAENSCVNLQTLLSTVSIQTTLNQD